MVVLEVHAALLRQHCIGLLGFTFSGDMQSPYRPYPSALTRTEDHAPSLKLES